MPADLIEAVTAWLAADTTVTSLLADGVAGEWGDEAPVGTNFPFLVTWKVDEETTYESSAAPGVPVPSDDEGEIQVSVLATSKSGANAIGQTVRHSLNDAPLRFDGGELLMIRQIGKHTVKDPELGPQGTDVWQTVCRFKTIVEHSQ